MSSPSSAARSDPLLWLLAGLGALGLGVALLLRDVAFPIAAIDFQVLRGDALERAKTTLKERGLEVEGYLQALSFEVDRPAQNYIERHLGSSAVNGLAQEEVSLWYWRVRFFRPLQKEEFEVNISPTGRVVGYRHLLPEATPGAALEEPQARRRAETYLRELAGMAPERYELVAAAQEQRPQRLDWQFTWERRDFALADARYRVRVMLQGDAVDGYTEFLKVPEAWSREMAKESQRGAILARVGWSFASGLALAAAAMFLVKLREGRTGWRLALALLGVLAGVGALAGANALSLLLVHYPTTLTLEGYLFQELQRALATYLPLGAVTVVAAAAGAALYREALPQRLPLTRLLSRSGWCRPEFVRAVLAGYFAAGLWLGYVTLFYWLGTRYLGVWNPIEVPYRDVMSTFLPLAFPLTVGTVAAISEEGLFRLFAIPWLLTLGQRWLGSRRASSWQGTAVIALAVVAPALIWGSLHANWPQQPYYIRALEVAAAGVISGLLFLRYGFLSTLVNHYVSNAAVVGALFFLSGNSLLILSGAVGILLPLLLLLPAALARLRGQALRDVASPSEPLPSAETVARPELPPPAPPEAPLPRRWLLGLGLLGGLALVGGLLFRPPRLGEFLRLEIDAGEARVRADAYLRSLSLDPISWLVATTFVDWSQGNDTAYLLRQLGTAATNALLAQETQPYRWQVRYFKEEEKESVWIWVGPRGQVLGHRHLLEEAKPGAELSPEAARSLAQGFLARLTGLPLAQYRLVDSSSERREGRVDHRFVWERSPDRVGEGSFRALVTVQGDQVGTYYPYFKTPEAFDRERAKRTATDVLLGTSRGLLYAALGVLFLVVLVRRFRRGALDLPFALGTGMALAALALVQRLNEGPHLWSTYRSTMSLTGYALWAWAEVVQSLLILFGAGVVVAGAAEALYREAFPEAPPLRRQLRCHLELRYPDLGLMALLALVLTPLFWAAVSLHGWALEILSPTTQDPEQIASLALLQGALPALGSLAANISRSLWLVLAGAAATLFLWRSLKRPEPLVLAAALVGLLLGTERIESWEELGIALVGWGGVALVGALLVAKVLRHRLWGYLWLLLLPLTLRDAAFLLSQGHPWLRAHGLLLLLMGLTPLLLGIGVALARGHLVPRLPERTRTS